MEKKNYIQPSSIVMTIQFHHSVLAASGPVSMKIDGTNTGIISGGEDTGGHVADSRDDNSVWDDD